MSEEQVDRSLRNVAGMPESLGAAIRRRPGALFPACQVIALMGFEVRTAPLEVRAQEFKRVKGAKVSQELLGNSES